MIETDVHKRKIEQFGPKEEFRKEVEVFWEQLKYSWTQMKLGG